MRKKTRTPAPKTSGRDRGWTRTEGPWTVRAEAFLAEFASEVRAAHSRIRDEIVRTPIELSPELSGELDAAVYLKWEGLQTTGSFKLRGAANKILKLTAEQRKTGVVSASTGNHGLAIVHAAKRHGVRLVLFLPENAAPEKIARLKAAGADVRFFGRRCELTEGHARDQARGSGAVFVSPYNDLDVIHGQGTVGLEIGEDLPDIQDVIVPIGGGGLIAGIGGYLKARHPDIRIVGVEPVNSAFMAASLNAGRQVEIPEKPTVADAVAGGLEPDSITVPLCRRFVDAIRGVNENSIHEAMRRLHALSGRHVEGAGALSLAAVISHRSEFRGRRVALVVSGMNISPSRFWDATAVRKKR